MKRWLPHLQGPPAVLTRRVCRRLQQLQTLTTPRVQAATWKLVWNGWCTASRFQQRSCANNRCKLGCSTTSEDSIEHYVHCPVVLKVAASRLRLRSLCLADFLLASASMSDELIAKMALLTYAVLRATNMYRHKSSKPSRADAFDAVERYLRAAPVGHRGCTDMLESIWTRSSQAVPMGHLLHATTTQPHIRLPPGQCIAALSSADAPMGHHLHAPATQPHTRLPPGQCTAARVSVQSMSRVSADPVPITCHKRGRNTS